MRTKLFIAIGCVFALMGGFALASEGSPAGDPPVRRVVCLGGALTETVFALGLGDEVVAVDASSAYPEQAGRLASLGYYRQVGAEGILSLRPTLVLASSEAGPPATFEQLRAAGVQVVQIEHGHTAKQTQRAILELGEVLEKEAEALRLAERVGRELEFAQRMVATATSSPRVLFIYARGGAVMNVSGTGTAADEMIRLAGGVNAISGYEGFRPLTAEALVVAKPDVILLMNMGLESVGGAEGLLEAPGVTLTPAGMNRRIVSMDDQLLLGFGPRLGLAVSELAVRLHPELSELGGSE